MVGDPGGGNAEITGCKQGRSSEDTGGGVEAEEEGNVIIKGGGFSGAHESAFAEEQYLNSPDFVLCKLLFRASSIFIQSVCL